MPKRFGLNPADSKKYLEKYDNYLTELFKFYPAVDNGETSVQSHSDKNVKRKINKESFVKLSD